MKAVAQVTLTALEPTTSASFLLNQNLNVQSVTESASPLNAPGVIASSAHASPAGFEPHPDPDPPEDSPASHGLRAGLEF